MSGCLSTVSRWTHLSTLCPLFNRACKSIYWRIINPLSLRPARQCGVNILFSHRFWALGTPEQRISSASTSKTSLIENSTPVTSPPFEWRPRSSILNVWIYKKFISQHNRYCGCISLGRLFSLHTYVHINTFLWLVGTWYIW